MKKLVFAFALMLAGFGFSQQLGSMSLLVGALRGVVGTFDTSRGFHLPGYGYHIVITGAPADMLEVYAENLAKTARALLGTVSLKPGEVLAVGYYNNFDVPKPFEALVVLSENSTETHINGEKR